MIYLSPAMRAMAGLFFSGFAAPCRMSVIADAGDLERQIAGARLRFGRPYRTTPPSLISGTQAMFDTAMARRMMVDGMFALPTSPIWI